MLDIFRLVHHEGVEEENAIIDEIAVKDFRRKNRESVLAQATYKFDKPESPRKMGILGPGSRDKGHPPIHARLLLMYVT